MNTLNNQDFNRKTIEGYKAADRIIGELETAGLYTYNPDEIIQNSDFLPGNLCCAWGASRVVIWDEEYDYVIKIAREKNFEKYNEKEVEVYKAALKDGLEDAFAWCVCYAEPSFYDDEYNPGVYVMEYLDGDEDEISERAYSYGLSHYCKTRGIEITSDACEEYEAEIDSNTEILELVMSTMEPKKAGLLDRFLFDWDINDIHCANVLFRNNTPVICDYAGWGW